ncbi:MAG: metallophosphoesterase [Thaumarchaeota archaeon]|nr:metallophosphoesterase [Candidatus Calditenuaceae archaeon]MDW8187009.1 metallophosphoesterase [Nitrososphaerota archaeon]
MRVAVISDTHDRLDRLRRALEEVKELGVEVLMHLGDYTSPFTLRELARSGIRTVGILGNNDGDPLSLSSAARDVGVELRHWPAELELDGRRILLVHGFGSREVSVRFAEALAASGYWDCVLYGHTHQLDIRRIERTLLLNPGEVFGDLTGRATFVTLNTEELTVEVHEL